MGIRTALSTNQNIGRSLVLPLVRQYHQLIIPPLAEPDILVGINEVIGDIGGGGHSDSFVRSQKQKLLQLG